MPQGTGQIWKIWEHRADSMGIKGRIPVMSLEFTASARDSTKSIFTKLNAFTLCRSDPRRVPVVKLEKCFYFWEISEGIHNPAFAGR